MTTPKAILIGSTIIAAAIIFSSESRPPLVTDARADVAGMDFYDLRTDYDFKKAVRHIVEDCTATGYVDGDYLYDSDINC